MRNIALRWTLAAALGLAACSAPSEGASAGATADVLPIVARSVPLNVRDANQTRTGKLLYRGGVSLTSSDTRFGGWSDIAISEDGRRLTAISDRAFWLDARIVHDEAGALTFEDARLGSLIDLAGRPLRGFAGDAEGLSRAPDGSFLVSFERRHRIWLYPAAEPPFSALPRIVPRPRGLDDAPDNGGIEALVRLPGGRLFALTEELQDRGRTVGWVGDGRVWQQVVYRPGPDFKPTGATRLPNGDVLVLERRFTAFGVPGARIVRLNAMDIRPGARLAGEEIALIEPPTPLDNFEGITAHPGPLGETLIYLMSDDNYMVLQRTLLLVFELLAE